MIKETLWDGMVIKGRRYSKITFDANKDEERVIIGMCSAAKFEKEKVPSTSVLVLRLCYFSIDDQFLPIRAGDGVTDQKDSKRS